jgi:enoyl-CoA hydratase/carnithine racemase
MGLVQRVVDPGHDIETAVALAEKIALQAPLAVRASRANALLAVEEGPRAAIARFRETQALLAQSDDAAEGVRSFVEKRAARFTGS